MIYQILHDIQIKLKAPKNTHCDFGNYNYRNAEDIIENIKPLLPENTVLICNTYPSIVGNDIYIKAVAELVYEGKETVENVSAEAWVKEPPKAKAKMDESQTSGSASSFAKKYALGNLFAIDDCKDPDGLNDELNKGNRQPAELVCKICGKKIEGYNSKNGYVSAEDAYKKLKGMCPDCYKTEKDKHNGIQKQDS